MDIIGHRGARHLFMENTLDGLTRALDLGVDGLEMDLHGTKDGVLILHHDFHLRKDATWTQDGRPLEGALPLVCDLTWEELGAYRVGKSPEDLHPIPSLTQVLAMLQGRSKKCAPLCLELKTNPLAPHHSLVHARIVDRLFEDLTLYGTLEDVTIMAFEWRLFDLIRRQNKELSVCCSTHVNTTFGNDQELWLGRRVETLDFMKTLHEVSGTRWAPFYGDLTEDLVVAAKDHGLKVTPWTVNEEADMKRMHAWGVDGLITDRPDVALRLFGR
jgi:glycerophosphoryl diester phosphodiesterase